MTKASCYLKQQTIDKLKAIQKEKKYDSLSETMKGIIELGIKTFFENTENIAGVENSVIYNLEKNILEEFEKANLNNTEYFLKLLGVNADIFRCVFDKTKIDTTAETANDQIVVIKKNVSDAMDTM